MEEVGQRAHHEFLGSWGLGWFRNRSEMFFEILLPSLSITEPSSKWLRIILALSKLLEELLLCGFELCQFHPETVVLLP